MAIKLLRNGKRNGKRMRRKARKFPIGRMIQRPGLTGIPDSMFVKLKYSDKIALNSNLTVPGFHLFRGNDIFDPDFTGAGHQPYLSDQFGPFYLNYNVHACKIVVKASTSSKDCKLLVRPTTVSTPGTDYSLALERPEARHCLLSDAKPCTIKHYQTTRSALGSGNPDDDLFHGTMGPSGPTSGPATFWYWAIYAEDVSGTQTITVDAQVELTYYVKLFGRRINSAS